MSNLSRAWAAYEIIGMGIPNPRAVTGILVPPDLTSEQLANLEAAIDRINAELEAKLDAEILASSVY
jgi:hypothetical protein